MKVSIRGEKGWKGWIKSLDLSCMYANTADSNISKRPDYPEFKSIELMYILSRYAGST